MGRNRKGFTLAELLIVVAIIGVLVAISIPVFTGQLEKARIAVDMANVRSAKAAAVAESITTSDMNTHTYYYNGTYVVEDPKGINGYGKSTKPDPEGTITGASTDSDKSPSGAFVSVTVTPEGNITARWTDGATSTASTDVPGNTVPPVVPSTPGSGGGTTSGGVTNDSEKSNVVQDISATYKWDQIKDQAGLLLPPGTTVSDVDGLYVVFGYDNYYSVNNCKSMSELSNSYPGKIRRFSYDETIDIVGNDLRGMTFHDGQLIQHESNGKLKYYVVVGNHNYPSLSEIITVEHETGFFFELK